VRFAEDPVRLLRAIKFATRLGFRIEDWTWEAMCSSAEEIHRSAPPRVLEEVMRLLRSGTALGAFRMLRASGVLAALFPTIDGYIGRRDDPDPVVHDRADLFWRLLEALDADVHAGREPRASVMLAALFLRVIERRADDWARAEPGRSVNANVLLDIASEELEPIATRARMARRSVERAKRIIACQGRFTQPSSKSFRPMRFVLSEDFEAALELFRLRSHAWGQGWDVYEGWVERHRRANELEGDTPTPGRRRRRSRGRRRRGTPPNGSASEDAEDEDEDEALDPSEASAAYGGDPVELRRGGEDDRGPRFARP
jgi:poly(A) polymerase